MLLTMDSRVINSKLSNHKIFKMVSECLPESDGNLSSLIEFKDDILYVWHTGENCLLTLNLKSLEDDNEDIPYQKLVPASPPAFVVRRLAVGAGGARACAWGARGACVLALPARWGRGARFDGGSEAVVCKSQTLDERFLYSQCEVRRVHWHPSSLSHLLVLLSDNTVRLYNVATKDGAKLVRVLNIGPKPTGLLAGKRILESLGDTTVDFTLAPGSDTLVMLRGNGDVYMMACDISSKSPLPPKLHGPLSMYPPADDNYGEDSCSIMAMGGGDIPTLIVIATCSAILYHCLLLPEPADDANLVSTEKRDGNGFSLYVVEAVELNVVLTAEEAHLQYSYPVHLYPGIPNGDTYACVHTAGVHTVTLPIISKLKEYALASEDETETLAADVVARASLARHVLCTRTPGLGGSIRTGPTGACVTAPPLASLLVLVGAQLVARTLEPFNLDEQLYKELQLKNTSLDQAEINKILKERQKLSFSSIIQDILTREVSQPVLKICPKEEPGAKESLEILTSATLILSQEYISRQDRASDAIRKKLKSVQSFKQVQMELFQDIQKDLQEVLSGTAALEEKCILAETHQDDIKHRCSAVLRGLRATLSTTSAERELLRELEKNRSVCEQYADQLTRLRARANNKTLELKNCQEQYKKKDVCLGKSHSDTISSILQQQTRQISEVVEEVKLLQEQLCIT